MRVLLTVPNSRCSFQDLLAAVPPPLGLGYIASYLRMHGHHDVKIYDGMLRDNDNHGFLRVLESFSPDVVGISGQSTSTIYDAYRAAKQVKKYDSNILVVIGGAHATFEDMDILVSCPEIDVVVRGEGEVIMNEIVDTHSQGKNLREVPGITIRNSSTISRNPDAQLIQNLDCFPTPAYDLINPQHYFNHGVRYTTMITSRGCPYRCSFCSSSRIYRLSDNKFHKARGRKAYYDTPTTDNAVKLFM